VLGVHHLEGHLLSPLLSDPAPPFPFVALLVSGGHTQFFAVHGVGDYRLLGETQDDAAGEAFDKTAKLLGLAYPGGPAIAALAERGDPGAVALPRPMLDSGDLDLSFSGLKTAVALRARDAADGGDPSSLPEARKADIAAAFQAAVVDVLVAKSLRALDVTGLASLVVAGGVGANQSLRARLTAAGEARGARVWFPEARYCTDNAAMIALAAAMRIGEGTRSYAFSVDPRWELWTVTAAGATK
jgi:N6-L-threonylcarbamoyladenine synthase